MSKSVYPAKFIPATAPSATPSLLPSLLFVSELPENYLVTSVGEFSGFGGFASPATFEALVVTLPSGVEVPAYRAAGGDFAVCQNFMFSPAK